jgi:hypothetical protein
VDIAGALFPIVVVGLFASFVVIAFFVERKRKERLAAFAAAIGWTYQHRAPQLVGRWRGQPFNVGSSRQASHLLAGTFRGRPAAAFQYQYSTGSGKNRSTTTLTVTMLSLPAALPDLEITNEGVGAKIAKAFGGQDIQFESEEFNRRWRVEGAVRKTVHDIVHPRFMDMLNAGPADPVRFEGTDLWTWHYGALQTDPMFTRLERLAAIADSVPRHVWQDYGYDPSAGAGGVR